MTGLCALVLVAGMLVLSASFTDADAAGTAQQAAAAKPRSIELAIERTLQALEREAAAAAKARARAAARARTLAARTPQAVICKVFGRHCRAALTVAHCESGLRIDAQNGQYLGLFQMGDWARASYGHGETAMIQAKAAHRLFVDTGRTWAPWSCKP